MSLWSHVGVLVRILEPPSHAGVILCLNHLGQLEGMARHVWSSLPGQTRVTFQYDEISLETVLRNAHKCLMCDVKMVFNRYCENPGCGRALAPQWPTVYCGNTCALEDA